MMSRSLLLVMTVVVIGWMSPLQAADINMGEAMYGAQCAQCHGRTGLGAGAFPALNGQTAEYIAGKLELYRAREQVGGNSALMWGPSANLSDADIANLSAFISERFQ